MRTKLTFVAALVIVAAASSSFILLVQSAMAKKGDAGSYDVGYKHGCSDASLSPSTRYINQPDKGPSQHSGIFMQGYTNEGPLLPSSQTRPGPTL